MYIEQFLKEVREEGYYAETYHDLLKLKAKDKKLVPIMLKYFNKVDKINEKFVFLSCLRVKGFTDATETLLFEFNASDDVFYKWSIAETLSIIQDKRREDDYIDIIQNKDHGIARQMIVEALRRIKSEKAIPYFIELLDDKDIDGHIVSALGFYKDYELINVIKPFLEHEKTWIRNKAKTSIRKLERHKR